MRDLITLLLSTVVFLIPWQEMAMFQGIGTLSRIFGYVVVGASALYLGVAMQVRRPPPLLFLLVPFVGWVYTSALWSEVAEKSTGYLITFSLLMIFFSLVWQFGDAPRRQIWLLMAYTAGCVVSTSLLFISFRFGQQVLQVETCARQRDTRAGP